MDEANRVLIDLLARYIERLAVPSADNVAAYRPIDPGLDLASVLCFKHSRSAARDITVEYGWHTFQLLLEAMHRGYAGKLVEVQERLDGNLIVSCQGQAISTREAPPRLDILCSGDCIPEHTLVTVFQWLHHILRQNETQRQEERSEKVASPPPITPRKRAPRQDAPWDAVQAENNRGLSLRAMARSMGHSPAKRQLIVV